VANDDKYFKLIYREINTETWAVERLKRFDFVYLVQLHFYYRPLRPVYKPMI